MFASDTWAPLYLIFLDTRLLSIPAASGWILMLPTLAFQILKAAVRVFARRPEFHRFSFLVSCRFSVWSESTESQAKE
jgi:hypothetical protein